MVIITIAPIMAIPVSLNSSATTLPTAIANSAPVQAGSLLQRDSQDEPGRFIQRASAMTTAIISSARKSTLFIWPRSMRTFRPNIGTAEAAPPATAPPLADAFAGQPRDRPDRVTQHHPGHHVALAEEPHSLERARPQQREYQEPAAEEEAVSYTHLRAHETRH